MNAIIEFFQVIVTPGMLPYTVMLGLVILYWITVIIGAMDIDIIDGPDFDVDGDMDADADAPDAGAFRYIVGFVNADKVPLTIILSFLIIKMWIIACLYYMYLAPNISVPLPPVVVGIILFAVAFFTATFLTGYTTRPLADVFEHKPTRGRQHLVGRECRVKTTSVTHDFGQAEVKIDQSFVLISARCSEATEFEKGDQAVVVGYDQEKDVYEIRKL